MASREQASMSGRKWFPYNKGGGFRKWYGNQDYVVDWYNDGDEIRNFGAESGRARGPGLKTPIIILKNQLLGRK
ncbi:MAG: hypothetical protein V9G25_09435 [Acidimicrobiia bacterium]